ncbi:MAG TPA: transglutaminase family protein [Acidimicrobiales bacterium]
MTFRINHSTTYTYEDEVTQSYGLLHMIPRDLPGQTCRSITIVIDPVPDFYAEHRDFFGNRVIHFEILKPHRKLSVLSASEVDIDRGGLPAPNGDVPWEAARDQLRDSAAGGGAPEAATLDATQFVLGSSLAFPFPELREYALMSFTPGRPTRDALLDLAARVHDDFRYEPGVTSVATTAEEAFEARVGVCQDFAHLVIGCLRSLGLAARYVSGYLETTPPPGAARLRGADASHAWTALFVPGEGWLDVDPTNRQYTNDRYTTVAWGRDYGDVPPLKGVIFTEGSAHDLDVVVDVDRLATG